MGLYVFLESHQPMCNGHIMFLCVTLHLEPARFSWDLAAWKTFRACSSVVPAFTLYAALILSKNILIERAHRKTTSAQLLRLVGL